MFHTVPEYLKRGAICTGVPDVAAFVLLARNPSVEVVPIPAFSALTVLVKLPAFPAILPVVVKPPLLENDILLVYEPPEFAKSIFN